MSVCGTSSRRSVFSVSICGTLSCRSIFSVSIRGTSLGRSVFSVSVCGTSSGPERFLGEYLWHFVEPKHLLREYLCHFVVSRGVVRGGYVSPKIVRGRTFQRRTSVWRFWLAFGPNVSGATTPLALPQLPPSGGVASEQAHAFECPPPDNLRRDIPPARSSPASRVTPIRTAARSLAAACNTRPERRAWRIGLGVKRPSGRDRASRAYGARPFRLASAEPVSRSPGCGRAARRGFRCCGLPRLTACASVSLGRHPECRRGWRH